MEGHHGALRHRDEASPSNAFQHVCRVMLDGTSKDLTKQKIEDFRVILHMIMHECSKANIETGKSWVFEHCQNQVHTSALMEYILSLAKTKSSQQEKVHLVYLVNDILFHSSRKQLPWMKDSMLPLLVPLLRLAYEADSEEYKAKMIKMITFWGEKNVFDGNVINRIKQAVIQPDLSQPPPPPPSQQQQQQQSLPPPPGFSAYSYHTPPPLPPPQQQLNYHPVPQVPSQQQQSLPQFPIQQQQQTLPPQPPFLQNQPSQPPQFQLQQQQQFQPQQPPQFQLQQQQQFQPPQPPPVRPYYDLPAGLMALVKCEDYQALDPNSIKLPFPKPAKTQVILDALDDFYQGLDLSSEDLVEKPESKIDSQGWEKGYLDFHFQLVQQKKKEKEEEKRYERRRSPDRYRRRSYSRHRSSSRSRSFDRRRRRSPSPRRSRGRSPRSPRGRSPRGRSPRGRSPRGRSPRRRSSRDKSPRESYRYQRQYSRSRSPVYSQTSMKKSNFRNSQPQAPPLKRLVNAPVGGGEVTVEHRYLGLGNTMDEYDSFRRNKSQAFNRREPPQPITCFKCNRVGHLARDCDSL